MATVVAIYFCRFSDRPVDLEIGDRGCSGVANLAFSDFQSPNGGEVFSNAMPAAGVGGEPVKAALLKRHYDVGYREGMASIILARTINMISELWFLAIGFVIVWLSPLPASFKALAAAGLAAFVGAAYSILPIVGRQQAAQQSGREPKP